MTGTLFSSMADRHSAGMYRPLQNKVQSYFRESRSLCNSICVFGLDVWHAVIQVQTGNKASALRADLLAQLC